MLLQVLGDDFIAALVVDLTLILRVAAYGSSLTTATSRYEPRCGQIIPVSIVNVATAAQLNEGDEMKIR